MLLATLRELHVVRLCGLRPPSCQPLERFAARMVKAPLDFFALNKFFYLKRERTFA